MLQAAIIILVGSISLLFLPQSVCNKITKMAEVLTGNYTIISLWKPIFSNKKRRYSTAALLLFLGLILLILSIGDVK
jgi:hypothetical protein